MIKENPNLYYTTPVYHMPIDDTGSAVEYIEAERTVVPDTTQQIIEVNAQHLIGQVVVEPIPNEYVNVLDATAEENSQVADGYIAYGKNGVRLVGTMTPSGSAIDFSDLDYTDEAIPGYYISAVNETDGIISVVREPLPEIPAAVSDLDNDVGYITAEDVPEIAGVPTNISDLRDDVGMMTIQDVRTYVFGGSISSTKAAAGDRLEVISITSFTTSSYQDLAEHCYSKPVHFIVEIDDDINVDFNDNLPASWNNAIFMHIDRVYLEGVDEELPIDATNWAFEVHRDYDGIIWRGTLTLYQGHLQGVLNPERPAPEIPTAISDLTDDIGIVTTSDLDNIPVSTFDNDAGYMTSYSLTPADKAEIIAEVEAGIDPVVIDPETEADIVSQVLEEISIPTAVSDLTNDLHFISADDDMEELVFDGTYNKTTNKAATVSTVTNAIAALDIPDSTSDLTNDSGFATTTYVDEAIAAIPSGGGSAVNPTTTREQDSGIGGYILYSGYSTTRENDSLFKTRDFSVSNVGTTTTLYVGNATDGSQNQVGAVALQGAADQTTSYYNTINTATLSRNVTNTLPASSGTILTSATTSVTPVFNSGTKIATIKVNNVNTDIFAPESSTNITKVSELTNDAGYITANDVPSVGIMAIPITYDEDTETYVSPFTTLNISRFDFPIVSYENRYYYLDSIDDTDNLMTFINPQYLVYHIANRDLGDGYVYGFTIGASYDSLTGNPIEVITPLIHAGNPSV